MIDLFANGLLVLGPTIFGLGLAIWGFTHGNKTTALWTGTLGVILLCVGFALQLQSQINKEQSLADTPAAPNAAEIAANRAYIAADTFGVIDIIEGRAPRFQVMVRNKGQTPARNVRFYSTAMILPHPFPDTLRELDVKPDGGVPITIDKDTAIQAGKSYPTPLTADEMTQVLGNAHRMTFFGEIRYDDVFGISRVTRFCIGLSGSALKEVMGKRGPNGAVEVAGVGLWHYCPRFNDAT
jgi:hypothetical protein